MIIKELESIDFKSYGLTNMSDLYVLLEELFPDYLKEHTVDEIADLLESFGNDIESYEKISISNFGIVFKTKKYRDTEKDMFLLYALITSRHAGEIIKEFIEEQETPLPSINEVLHRSSLNNLKTLSDASH